MQVILTWEEYEALKKAEGRARNDAFVAVENKLRETGPDFLQDLQRVLVTRDMVRINAVFNHWLDNAVK